MFWGRRNFVAGIGERWGIIKAMKLSRLTIRILVPLMLLLLIACFTGYSQNGNKVAWHDWNEGTGRNVHYLEGADPVTFRVLAKDSYAKDKTYVWYQTRRLAGADAGTFQVLSDTNYGKDSSRVYFQDVLIPQADPKTFTLLSFAYSRDNSHVFCGTAPVKVYDINSFEVIMGSNGYQVDYCDPDPLKNEGKTRSIIGNGGWARDKVAYYYGAHEIEGTDYASFVVINEYYAKDKNKVYYECHTLRDADPATFVVIKRIEGKDKNQKYFCGDIDNR